MVLVCALGYYAGLPALQEDGQAAGRIQGGAVLPAKVELVANLPSLRPSPGVIEIVHRKVGYELLFI